MDSSLSHSFTAKGLIILVLFSKILITTCEDACIQLFDKPSNFFMACSTCVSENGTLLSLKHLIYEGVQIQQQKAIADALSKYGAIWIDGEAPLCEQNLTHFSGQCKAFVTENETFLNNVSCSYDYNFFCYHVGVTQSDSRCSKAVPPDVTTTARAKNTPLPANTPVADYNIHLTMIIAISAVSGSIVVITVVVTCCLCRKRTLDRRSNKATRAESQVPSLERYRMQRRRDSHHYDVPRIGPVASSLEPGTPRVYVNLSGEKQHHYTCLSPRSTF